MINTLRHFDPEDPYPDSDGQPMAENTLQFKWIVKIKENLEILFADRPDVFVAGDLFWYPDPDPDPDRQTTGPVAPDVLVVFGRPKGSNGSETIRDQVIDRVLLERTRWTAIRSEVQRAFNARLKKHNLATGSWKVGETMVDR